METLLDKRDALLIDLKIAKDANNEKLFNELYSEFTKVIKEIDRSHARLLKDIMELEI